MMQELVEKIPQPEKEETAIEREFSLENINSYGQMCINTALKLEGMLKEATESGKRVGILVPSRGAVPVLLGALLACKHEPLFLGEDNFENLPQKLILPPTRSFHIFPEINESIGERKIPILLFPYTADINFSDTNPNLSEEEKIELAGRVRKFCVIATGALYQKLQERERNLEFQRFLRFLRIVEGNKKLVEHYQNFPQVDHLIIIDTVISGRAATTILDEFTSRNFPHDAILVVDKAGDKLQPPFKRKLLEYPDSLIRMPRILTEDRGAALEGVVAVVYPGLMLESQHRGTFVSTGNWHDVPENARGVYEESFKGFLNLIMLNFQGEEGGTLEEQRAEFLNFLRSQKLLTHEHTTPPRARDFITKQEGVEKVSETSAHVVQIMFSQERTKRLADQILS